MDALDKAIAEVRAVREFDEMMLEMESERDGIISAMEGWLKSGEVNRFLRECDAVNISAAFAAGWVGGREYAERRR